MMNVLTGDGGTKNDTLAKLLRLRNHIDKIYDNFQACCDGEIILSKDDFRDTDLVNLDAMQYAGSNEVSHHSTPKHFSEEKYSNIDGFSGDGFKSLFLILRSQSNNSGFSIYHITSCLILDCLSILSASAPDVKPIIFLASIIINLAGKR